MNNKIENLKKLRQFLLNLIAELTPAQLNEIPDGFSNNIIWNLAHLVSAQQGVCYLRAGLPITTEQKYFEPYRPGTKPESMVEGAEIEHIKELLFSTIDKLQSDYQQNIFENYSPWTTRYGVEIANIDDIIDFLAFHEGLHSGCIMALKRSLVKA